MIQLSDRKNCSSIRLNKSVVFSLGFMAPVFLLLQFFLVPGLFWFAAYFISEIQFLERFNENNYTDAAIVASLGLVGFIGGFFLPTRPRRRIAFDMDWNLQRAVKVAVLFFFANTLYRGVNYFFGLGDYTPSHYTNIFGPEWVGVLFSMTKYQIYCVILIIVAFMSAEGESRKKIKPWAITVLILIIFSGIVTRSRTGIFMPLLSLSFIYSIFSSKQEVKRMLIMLAALVPVALIVKDDIRSGGQLPEFNMLAYSVAEFLQRIDMIQILEFVVSFFEPVLGASVVAMYTINMLPYDMAAMLADLNAAYIGGNEFGRMTGIISQEDYVTGVAIPLVADLFINFGAIGVFLGMALLGLVARKFQDSTFYRPSCSHVFAFASLLPLFVSGLEHQVGNWLADATKFGFMYLFVILFLKKNRRVVIPNHLL